MHDFKAKQIPALDGLRGLAILLVVTHHQLIPLSLKGGFLGVDLFFVLSGFLITTLLLTEFDAAGSISLKHFYMRRVLRLAPALLLYLLATLAATALLHPADLVREVKLVGLALAYLTNWRMAMGWDSSFDPTAITWSLSIEEQFYLIWPVLFLGLSLLKTRRSHLIFGLSAVILVILYHRYSLWTSGADVNRLYYSTDTRADAPLMGCLLALITVVPVNKYFRRTIQILTALVACTLTYLVLKIDVSSPFLYAGGYTVVALLSGILIWGAANVRSVVTSIFELKPLRWFGKISYGFYLWHWLLLKTTSFYFLVGAWDPWARFLFAVAVSALSFYLVEQPFNRLKRRFGPLQFQPAARTGDQGLAVWAPVPVPQQQ